MLEFGIKFLAAWLALSVNWPAKAAQICAPVEKIVGHLAGAHGETPVVQGVDGEGKLMLMLANKETTSWTLLVVLPDRTACVMGDGMGWSLIEKLPGVQH